MKSYKKDFEKTANGFMWRTHIPVIYESNYGDGLGSSLWIGDEERNGGEGVYIMVHGYKGAINTLREYELNLLYHRKH